MITSWVCNFSVPRQWWDCLLCSSLCLKCHVSNVYRLHSSGWSAVGFIVTTEQNSLLAAVRAGQWSTLCLSPVLFVSLFHWKDLESIVLQALNWKRFSILCFFFYTTGSWLPLFMHASSLPNILIQCWTLLKQHWIFLRFSTNNFQSHCGKYEQLYTQLC